MDAREVLERMQTAREFEERKRKFYGEFVPTIAGRVFRELRSYGHARYEILPHGERSGEYTLFHYEESGEVVITEKVIADPLKTLRIGFRRLGGFDGSGEGLPTLKAILKEFLS